MVNGNSDVVNHLRFVTALWWIMMALAVITSLAMFMIFALLADGAGGLVFYILLLIPFFLLCASAVGLLVAVDWKSRGVSGRVRRALGASIVTLIATIVASIATMFLGIYWFAYFIFSSGGLAIVGCVLLSILVGRSILKAKRELRVPE